MMQDWFKDAKLGIFVHYGIYSAGGSGESWAFHNGGMTHEDYMKQGDSFTASKYDAKEWAKLFKDAGAKYAVLTTKHHDGVALWDTDTEDKSVVKDTPAGRDLIGPYIEALEEEGLRVGLYYSLTNWSSADYRSIYNDDTPEENWPKENEWETPAGGPEDHEAWERHLESNNEQIKELMTRYGTVDLLWFDGDWERTAEQWKMAEFREYLHELNPEVILNSRMRGYGDYATPERGIPIYQPDGVWEYCNPIGASWAWARPESRNRYPHYWSNSREIIRQFTDCLSLGGNLLLNLAPYEDGTFAEEEYKVLEDLGQWNKDNGEAVYGTQAGVDLFHYNGGSTISKDGKNIYLFVHDIPTSGVGFKGVHNKIKNITLLHTGEELPAKISGGAPWNNIPGTLWIDLKEEQMHPLGATVIKVEVEDSLELYTGTGQAITYNE